MSASGCIQLLHVGLPFQNRKMQKQNGLLYCCLPVVLLLIHSPPPQVQSQHTAVATTASRCFDEICGGIVVSYPFALAGSPACRAFSTSFLLHCDALSGTLFINMSTNASLLQVTDITSDSLVVDVSSFIATFALADYSECSGYGASSFMLPPYPGPFVMSDDNVLGGFGCNQLSISVAGKSLQSDDDQTGGTDEYDVGGCSSLCLDDEFHDPNCGNLSCCISTTWSRSSPRYASITVQTATAMGSDPFNITCDPKLVHSAIFHPKYTDLENGAYRLKLRWALPFKETDEVKIKQSSDYACSSNSVIIIVEGVPGYRCSCGPGYVGDGYLDGYGCIDFNECDGWNDCVSGSTCHNEEGSYRCSCNGWFNGGDGHKNGSGCHFPHSVNLAIIVCIVVVSVLCCGVCSVTWWKTRTKRKYFVQNGGLQFEKLLKRRPGGDTMRLFMAEELEAATNNYADAMKLGVGGSGMVFKGVLNDGMLVAIKRAINMRSKIGGDGSKQFLNEMAILIQINHRHIVRLLGCCLETEVPLLVYEYAANGSLEGNLRGRGVVLSWKQRLKVAQQAAEALAYLHVAAWPPILHRDIKSANVLLDDKLDAKITDFGLSCLVPEGAEQVVTAMQGTIGYVDPEYFFTFQFTDKSDVYSFGVVLAELITGRKPVSRQGRDAHYSNLALLFVEMVQKGSLEELVDPHLGHILDAHPQSCFSASVMAVAALALRCLALEGSARPSMNEVAHELWHISDSLQTFADGYDNGADLFLHSSREHDYEFELGAKDTVEESQSYSPKSAFIEREFLALCQVAASEKALHPSEIPLAKPFTS